MTDISNMPAAATASVTSRGENRIRRGHLWVFRSDVIDVRAEAGDVVRLLGSRGRVLGYGMFSDRSAIAIRVLTREDRLPDDDWWRRRLATAGRHRDRLAIDATAWRLVHGEGDLLPSLVVDRYADVLVVQALSQGMNRQLPRIVRLLDELVQPAGILARNDPRVRALEGLDRTVELLSGEVPETLRVREGAIELDVHPWTGQKTGLFLDQRENRAAAAGYARGRALDMFSHTGGFALQMASRCDEVLAVDISGDAVAAIDRHASLNAITNIRSEVANAFDLLRELDRRGERFDTIVLDPPAFAKRRSAMSRAVAGYKEINIRALKLLTPGGTLVTCSCSYHVDESTLGGIVADAAGDARIPVVVAERRMQSRDHPVLLGVPETYYLKCFVVQRIE
jgi:23S rRNA (cytosine1962-C5)-methyltransferase